MSLKDREWNPENLDVFKEQLGQFLKDVQRELAELAYTPMQLLTAEGVTTTGKLEMKFGFAHKVHVPSAYGVRAVLPRWYPETKSAFTAIVRMAATGTVTVTCVSKINMASSITLPAVVGVHLFWCDNTNYWSVET